MPPTHSHTHWSPPPPRHQGHPRAHSPSFNHSCHCSSLPHRFFARPIDPSRDTPAFCFSHTLLCVVPCLALIARMRSLVRHRSALIRSSLFASHRISSRLHMGKIVLHHLALLACFPEFRIRPTSRLRARSSDLAHGSIASDLALRISGVYSLPFWPPRIHVVSVRVRVFFPDPIPLAHRVSPEAYSAIFFSSTSHVNTFQPCLRMLRWSSRRNPVSWSSQIACHPACCAILLLIDWIV